MSFASVNAVGGLALVAVLSGLLIALTYSTTTRMLSDLSVEPLLAIAIGLVAGMVIA